MIATCALAATSVAVCLVPGRALLRRLGTLDVPSYRSSHTVPVLRGAGIVIAPILVAIAPLFGVRASPSVVTAGSAAILFWLIGSADDLAGGISAQFRLCLSVCAVIVVGLLAYRHLPLPLAVLIAPVLLTGVNSFNFMDGLNGMAATHMLVHGGALAALASDAGMERFATLGALLAGAGVGFLPWNFPRAHLFLGDSGAYAAGALLGALGVLVGAEVGPITAVVFAPYLADTGLTLVRRLRRGVSPWTAHREHAYQRLTDLGLPQAASTGVYIAASVICAFVAIRCSQERATVQLVIMLMVAAAAGGFVTVIHAIADSLALGPRKGDSA